MKFQLRGIDFLIQQHVGATPNWQLINGPVLKSQVPSLRAGKTKHVQRFELDDSPGASGERSLTKRRHLQQNARCSASRTGGASLLQLHSLPGPFAVPFCWRFVARDCTQHLSLHLLVNSAAVAFANCRAVNWSACVMFVFFFHFHVFIRHFFPSSPSSFLLSPHLLSLLCFTLLSKPKDPLYSSNSAEPKPLRPPLIGDKALISATLYFHTLFCPLFQQTEPTLSGRYSIPLTALSNKTLIHLTSTFCHGLGPAMGMYYNFISLDAQH